jgi:sigma-B regulation protein RsbU (phosphoserine phosphatase)
MQQEQVGQQAKQVLVVDDSASVRSALIEYLGQQGFRARGAEDGVSGLEQIQSDPPDLLLCDLRMPRMDGLELMEKVHTRLPDLPVVVMSGAGLVRDVIGALKLGASDYVEKPILDLEVLGLSVRRALERAALVEENRRYRANLERVNRELHASLSLLADEEDAGRQIQARMLPRNHQRFGPFEFSYVFAPSAFLSGDFVDAFEIDDHRWAFYLADVAGHGVSSALVTVVLRAFVQRHSAEHARTGDGLVLSPAGLLDRLNQELSRDNLGKHLTIFYGVVDTREGSLVCANAGHFPWPLLYDGERTVSIEQPSLPAGLLPGTRYREQRVTLPERMVLSVFSDGLLELVPHSSLADRQAFLRALFGRGAATVEQLRGELRLDGGLPLPDDVAIVLIKRGDEHGEPHDGPRSGSQDSTPRGTGLLRSR